MAARKRARWNELTTARPPRKIVADGLIRIGAGGESLMEDQ